MTVAGYNMGGDLDQCARETDQTKFLASAKKLGMQRNVSQRTIMLWCYLRSENDEMKERLHSWIEEEDKKKTWLMDLPEYVIDDGSEEEESSEETSESK